MLEFSEALTASNQIEEKKIFDELVNRYHKQAYNIAYRMTGNQADAEDLTQDTFVKAFRFFSSYKKDLPFENWIYRIMSNLHVDLLRRRPKAHIRSLDEPVTHEDGVVAFEIADTSEGPESLAISSELDARMQIALNTLSPDFKMTVVLSDIEGLSYEEISEVMHCSIGTVRSRLHRGRKLLREKLRPYVDDRNIMEE
jgi:RNA polymerase sigma-70 factor (ECF subfamily)